MIPNYDSAIVAKDGKSNIYQTTRVIDVFNLCNDIESNAFAGTLLAFGKTVTDKQIKAAQDAYDDVIEKEKVKQDAIDAYEEEQELISRYRESLIDLRDCIVNTNNNNSFLLPYGHKLYGRYHSFTDVIAVVKDSDFVALVSKHSNEMDKFVLEPVSTLTVDRLYEVDDERD